MKRRHANTRCLVLHPAARPPPLWLWRGSPKRSARRRHATAAAARTEAPPLARERHEPLLPTPHAPEPRESGCEAATGQEVLKRALNKPGQSLPIAVLRRLRAKRLVVLAHDLMERVLLGPTRAIAEGGGHGTAIRRKARALCAEGFPSANRITILDHCSFCVPA
jgi:hypothetical protein